MSAKNIVVLIHGIRTEAAWAEMVAALLENEDCKVIPVRYGYFDLIRFWSPLFFRGRVVKRIIREIRDIRAHYPNSRISVIAHSFGTYALVRALQQPDIRLHRVIFCGSIVKNDFRRAPHAGQLGPDPILNDCGTHDVWPALAKASTWGYGSTGSFGFGTVGIHDRFHRHSHSTYFNRDYVTRYWKPFIEDGEIVRSDIESNRSTPPYWQSLIGILPLKYIPLFAFLLLPYFWLNPEHRHEVRIAGLHASHWIGTPRIYAQLQIMNNTIYEIQLTNISMTITDDIGQIYTLGQEEVLSTYDSEGNVINFNPIILNIPAKTSTSQDYSVIGSFSDIAETVTTGHNLMVEAYSQSPALGIQHNPSSKIYPEEFVSAATELFKSLYIWKSGVWQYTLQAYIDRKPIEVSGEFNLTPAREAFLRRIVRFYASGAGITPVWRDFLSHTERNWVRLDLK